MATPIGKLAATVNDQMSIELPSDQQPGSLKGVLPVT